MTAARALTLLAAIGLGACAARGLPSATGPDVRRAQRSWPDADAAQLQRGRALVQRKCAGCHQPVPPKAHPPEAWPKIVDTMAERAKLAPEEREDMLRYLVTMSEAER